MRKKHLDSDFIAHSSLYLLQKGPDGISVQINPMRCTDGGLRCKGRGYIRKGTPQKRGMNILQEENTKRESKGSNCKTSPLRVNEKPVLELGRGRIYAELEFLSFILITLVVLVLSL